MSLPINSPFPPMEAQIVDEVPSGRDWQYEPKWDGFRCLVFRDGAQVHLQSKAGQPLGRYFPDVVKEVLALKCSSFVLDSEIVIPIRGRLSFDDLLMRIHPAESRVTKLASEFPAVLIVFDLLVDDRSALLTDLPLRDRRRFLEKFVAKYTKDQKGILLSPATDSRDKAVEWLKISGTNMDGVIAKKLDLPYKSGERTGMKKIKRIRTADCVVGGFRYSSDGKGVGSLLLGLFNADGLLDHVGFTSGLKEAEKRRLLPKVKGLIQPPGFTGRAPGGPSRWSTERSTEWEPLRPELVVEVQYDHFTGRRFRHGTRIIRWRTDKTPEQCTIDQLDTSSQAQLSMPLSFAG